MYARFEVAFQSEEGIFQEFFGEGGDREAEEANDQGAEKHCSNRTEMSRVIELHRVEYPVISIAKAQVDEIDAITQVGG